MGHFVPFRVSQQGSALSRDGVEYLCPVKYGGSCFQRGDLTRGRFVG